MNLGARVANKFLHVVAMSLISLARELLLHVIPPLFVSPPFLVSFLLSAI